MPSKFKDVIRQFMHPSPDKPETALFGFYLLTMVAVFLALVVILLMNLSTPVEFSRNRLHEIIGAHKGFHTILQLCLLLLVTGVASLPLLWILKQVLKPVRCYLVRPPDQPGQQVLKQKAGQRLINLPFIMVPMNLILWIITPAMILGGLFFFGRMDFTTAVTFGIRSVMVGITSCGLLFFLLETHARHTLIPVFFPKGRLTSAKKAKRISIERRIRAFYRMGSLIPLLHIVLTLFALYLQVNTYPVPTEAYAKSVLLFSLVVFGIFFFGTGIFTRLISRSIADPVNDMLLVVNQVKQGNFTSQTRVVTNDEIGVLGDAVNQAIQGLGEGQLLRDAFGRYVDPRIRDEILSGRIPLDGEYKSVTVLFADLRDFTPFTAAYDPKTVVMMINAYFKAMEIAIAANKGLILQFLGDEIYAVFGAPVSDPRHASNAVSAALDMESRLTELNREFKEKKLPSLSHGIGIHTGQVLAANIGSPNRLSYLLVGDTVNLASRLQKKTRDLDVAMIVSQETVTNLEQDPGILSIRPHKESIMVKGWDKPVAVYVRERPDQTI